MTEPIRKLVVLDDVFPHPLSAFRFAEFNAYLERFDTAEVRSSAASFLLFNDSRTFEAVREEYGTRFPSLKPRVKKLDRAAPLNADFVYALFLNNIHGVLDMIEPASIPFGFTLYPGGGLALDDETSDHKLRRVFSSEGFRWVIVSQPNVYDYLLAKEFCEPDRIRSILGSVTSSEILKQNRVPKRHFARDKPTFDVCFSAYRYTRKGREKGYDMFVKTAHELARRSPDFRFHVVGGFQADDVDVSSIGDRIMFYGARPTEFFAEFYSAIDLMLSPNLPFVWKPGVFDGFPTGSSKEAGLCGVPVFCTDLLKLNRLLEDRRDVVIIPHDAERIADIIMEYHRNPHLLIALSRRTAERFHQVFGREAQIKPRIALMEQSLAGP